MTRTLFLCEEGEKQGVSENMLLFILDIDTGNGQLKNEFYSFGVALVAGANDMYNHAWKHQRREGDRYLGGEMISLQHHILWHPHWHHIIHITLSVYGGVMNQGKNHNHRKVHEPHTDYSTRSSGSVVLVVVQPLLPPTYETNALPTFPQKSPPRSAPELMKPSRLS